jgi:hypothetical protein
MGVRVELRGRVLGNFATSFGLIFAMHDHTGGIAVANATTFAYSPSAGDSILIRGVVSSVRGNLTLMNLDTVRRINVTSRPMTSTVVTTLSELTENEPVRINRVKFITTPPGATWSTANANYPLVNAQGDTILLRVPGGSAWSGVRLPSTTWFDVEGVGAQSSSSASAPFAFDGYQIIATGPQDIIAPLTRFTLEAPASNTTINAQGDPTTIVTFHWTRSFSSLNTDTVTYTFQLDTISGNFSTPLLSSASLNDGRDTMMMVSYADFLAAMPVRDSMYHAKWRVVASTATLNPDSRVSDTVYFINVIVGIFTGIHEAVNTPRYLVYPVPAREVLNVVSESFLMRYNLFDLSGRSVSGGRLEGLETRIGTAGLQRGVYLLELISEGGRSTQKIVIE